jgi:PST family polysaccharide transporter
LGLYDRAYQLFRIPMQQVGAPMTKVGMPILSRLQADERYNAYALRAQLVLAYAFGGTFFVIAAVSDPAIDLLLGPGWQGAKPILAILAIGGVFQGIGFVYYWVLLSRGLTGLQLRWTIIGRSATIAAIVAGLPWGPTGVAIGSTIGLALYWALMTVFPMRKTGVPRGALLGIAARPILTLAPVTGVCIWLSYVVLAEWSPWAELAVLAGVIVVYLAAAVAAVPHLRRDLADLWDVMRRLKR